MAAPITAGSADATAFHALTSFEQQVQWCINRLASMEAQYNVSNPDAPQERVTVAPDYDANSVESTVNLAISATAVENKITDSVVAYLA